MERSPQNHLRCQSLDEGGCDPHETDTIHEASAELRRDALRGVTRARGIVAVCPERAGGVRRASPDEAARTFPTINWIRWSRRSRSIPIRCSAGARGVHLSARGRSTAAVAGKNKGLKDKALADASSKQPWDPSIQAMAALPDVVKRLADDIQWTTDLGNAFLSQQSDVMDAVQRMRKKAQDKGTSRRASSRRSRPKSWRASRSS